MTGVLQINDLENLIGLYREWHSHILPYYSFEHFVHKVEQVAATKRVKVKMTVFCSFTMSVSQRCTYMASKYISLA